MAFKLNLSALGVCAALLVAAQANAANDVTLKVSGSVVPAACTPTLSNSGEVSFGSIAAASIRTATSGNTLVQLGSKDINLSVTCDASASVGLKVTDNRSSSAVALSANKFLPHPIAGFNNSDDPLFGFGLGKAANNANIGVYTIVAVSANATIDGAAAKLYFTDDNGANWRTDTAVRQRLSRITGIGKAGGAAPDMFTEISVPLKISAGVQTSDILGFDEINFDGNATLSLVYL
ncbi:DUF1120 domain-containing protein [Leclercia barmai]|uniref:DUF1120 domain-containing protein n=1 Tax=Enterobacteriaceae TaxID=543 RepID=UPI001106F486|nr:DUF1120 domain-containing protein [Enterobacter sp. MF024]TLU66579.1 DUF1120 domain-containing protein [Enterobacter sp. MF024]